MTQLLNKVISEYILILNYYPTPAWIFLSENNIKAQLKHPVSNAQITHAMHVSITQLDLKVLLLWTEKISDSLLHCSASEIKKNYDK